MKRITALIVGVVLLLALCACGRGGAEDTVRIDKKSAQMIAHRGLSGLEIENTEAAFVAAGERSYFGIEADVRKTADGKFVICHDGTLLRISGTNLPVETSTLGELLEVPLLDNDGKLGGGGRLCELDTYISICKSYGKEAILELKSEFSKQEIAQIIDVIRSYEYVEGVTFISFHYANLEYVREALPNHSVQYLFSTADENTVNRLIRDGIDVAIAHYALTEELLRTFHGAGLAVNCWTVDDKETAERLASLGVDYITTNILE